MPEWNLPVQFRQQAPRLYSGSWLCSAYSPEADLIPCCRLSARPDCLLELMGKSCCQAKKPHKRLWGSMALEKSLWTSNCTNPRLLRWEEPKII